MSAVITSRSMPSRGTKYSFCRAEAAIAVGGGAFDLECLPDMVGEVGYGSSDCKRNPRRPDNDDGNGVS